MEAVEWSSGAFPLPWQRSLCRYVVEHDVTNWVLLVAIAISSACLTLTCAPVFAAFSARLAFIAAACLAFILRPGGGMVVRVSSFVCSRGERRDSTKQRACHDPLIPAAPSSKRLIM